MGKPESFWKPTTRDYQLSFEGVLEAARDREALRSIETNADPHPARGKILTKDRARLTRKEIEDQFLRPRRNFKVTTDVLERLAQFPASRFEIYCWLGRYVFSSKVTVPFENGTLRLKEGSMKTCTWMLQDITGWCADTIQAALEDLVAAGLIHLMRSWDGTIITVLGFSQNRKTDPYTRIKDVSVEEIALSLAQVMASFRWNGKDFKVRTAPGFVREYLETGRVPPPPN